MHAFTENTFTSRLQLILLHKRYLYTHHLYMIHEYVLKKDLKIVVKVSSLELSPSLLFSSALPFSNLLLLGVAVVGNLVGRALDVAVESIGGSVLDKVVGDGLDAANTINRHGVQGKTNNVRSGHGGSADGLGVVVTSEPGREDISSGSKDVEDLAEVGVVRGKVPVLVNGTDSDGGRSTGRRNVVGILGLVTSSNDAEHARLGSLLDGTVKGVGAGSTQAHVDGGLAGAVLGDDVVDSPVEAVEDDGGGGALALEDLDGEQVGLLGNTIGLSADGAGNVGSMANAVLSVVLEDGVGLDGTALKLGVSVADAGVDDVGICALAGIAVIDVLCGSGLAVRDGSQAVGDTVLSDEVTLLDVHLAVRWADLGEVKVPDLVLLNESDLQSHCQNNYSKVPIRSVSTYISVVADLSNSVVVKVTSVTLEAALVFAGDAMRITLLETAGMDAVHPRNMRVDILGAAILEGNNVVARDGLAVLAGDGCSAALTNEWNSERGAEEGGRSHSHRLDVDHDDEKGKEKLKRGFGSEQSNEWMGWVGMIQHERRDDAGSYILSGRDITPTKADYQRTKANSECPNIMPEWRKHKPQGTLRKTIVISHKRPISRRTLLGSPKGTRKASSHLFNATHAPYSSQLVVN